MGERKPWDETWEVGRSGIETENGIPVLIDELGVFDAADARLAAAAPDLVRALLAVELAPGRAPGVDEECPWCGSIEGQTHAADCLRQVALRKAGVIE